ncbi:Ubiquitin-like protein [Phytophthora pseudosyringae]|uniref:Ubiquitin-like protein n=1 Tax=Phytophthora pseudosyringae TaxID=221518 RepID=A0A8T1VHV1_9STRA|nr:Ubiquitin-like protein [Phytophthora pseudosyringae]
MPRPSQSSPESFRVSSAAVTEIRCILLAPVTLQFVAVGSAPLLKRTKFTVSGHDQLSVVYKFLKKQLRLKEAESLFVYCNSSFAPSPDQRLSSLFESFQVGDVLVLNYSLTQAWG